MVVGYSDRPVDNQSAIPEYRSYGPEYGSHMDSRCKQARSRGTITYVGCYVTLKELVVDFQLKFCYLEDILC